MRALTPLRSEKVWGYEDWIASTHADGCQDELQALCSQYPLLVKIIQADDTLSVQVHPDDQTAVRLEGEGQRGKTECWLVLDAKPGAALIYGLKNGCSLSDLKNAAASESIEGCLNKVEVHTGDFIFIPAGTVHAIGAALRLLEVQQSCNITYRLYDWGRPREIHVEKALQCIKEGIQKEIAPLTSFSCDYFSLESSTVEGSLSFTVPLKGKDLPSGVELLFILEGEGTICAAPTDGQKKEAQKPVSFKKEQIFALCAGEQITLSGSARIIRIKDR